MPSRPSAALPHSIFDRNRRSLAVAAMLGCLLALVCAASASAAVRFAAPGGKGPEPCKAANPCSLFNAADVSIPAVKAGDEVIVSAGTYSEVTGDLGPKGSVSVAQGVSVEGVPGGARPLISATSGIDLPALALLPGASLSHLTVNAPQRQAGIFMLGGIAEDLIVRTAAANGIACRQSDGLIRNTVCLSSGPEGTAIGDLPVEGVRPNKEATLRLRNVTAVATGTKSRGLSYELKDTGPSPSIAVDVLSTIARGTEADVVARSFVNAPGQEPSVTVDLTRSDFATTLTPEAEALLATDRISEPNENENVEAAPIFAADGFHQVGSSPTIDFGATDPISATTDIDGQSRTLGAAPDIGADEFAVGDEVTDTATSETCSPDIASLALGTTTICTATVRGQAPVSGEVEFSNLGGPSEGKFSPGPKCVLQSVTQSEARCTREYQPLLIGTGTHKITAKYLPDSGHRPSQDTFVLRVGQRLLFVAAGRHGLPPCTNPTFPCSLGEAAGVGGSGQAGDLVFLGPGLYTDSGGDFPSRLTLVSGIHVVGPSADGVPTARLAFQLDNRSDENERDQGAFLTGQNSIVEDLIVSGDASRQVYETGLGSLSENIRVTAHGNEGIACGLERGTLRNSSCFSDGPNGVALGDEITALGSATLEAQAKNVTAFAIGEGATGVSYNLHSNREHSVIEQKVTLSGVIAHGSANDVAIASKPAASKTSPSAGAKEILDFDHSDYATVKTDKAAGSIFTPAGTGTNLTASPLLGADHLHQLQGSPTIDTGPASAAGELDVDGQPRVQGKATDIGADEFLAGSKTELSCAPSQVVELNLTTCTATVTDLSGAAAPSGRVDVATDSQGNLSAGAFCTLAPKGGASASCQFSYQPLAVGSGTHVLTARFAGPGLLPSSGTTALSVKQGVVDTVTSIVCSPNPVSLGSGSNCVTTVADTSRFPSAPTGQVAGGINGACNLQPRDASSSTCATDVFPVNRKSLPFQVQYPGDAHHHPSTGSTVLSVKTAAEEEAEGVEKHPSSVFVSCQPQPVAPGSATTCGVIVEETQTSAQPEGTVSAVSDTPGSFGAGGTCTLVGDGAGEANCSLTYTPRIKGSGTHALTFSYSGDVRMLPGKATANVTVEGADVLSPTKTELACQPPTVAAGRASKCTATVTDTAATGGTPPGGLVSFASDGNGIFETAVGCRLSPAGPGSSSCVVGYVPLEVGSGTHTITASYGGEDAHETSSGTATLTVSAEDPARNPTTTTLHCAPGTVALGGRSTCLAKVADNAAAPTVPGGSVRFFNGNGGTLSSGARCDLLPTGDGGAACAVVFTAGASPTTEPIVASYQGDGAHRQSQGADQVTVIDEGGNDKHATKTVLACDPAAVLLLAASTCTATVEDIAADATSAPSGEVTFQSDSLGAFTAQGKCALSPLASGPRSSCQVIYTPSEGTDPHHLLASYEGSAQHRRSQGQASLAIGGPDLTVTTLACQPDSLLVGDASTCVATVAESADPTVAVGGVVSFSSDGEGAFSDGASCTLAVPGGGGPSSCQLTYVPSGVGLGSHQLTASYLGEPGHRPSQGTTTVTVGPDKVEEEAEAGKNPTTTAVDCEPGTLPVATPSTCSVAVTDTSAAPSAPSGRIQLSSSDAGVFSPSTECVLTPSGQAKATCEVSFRPTVLGEGGSQTLTALYPGDGSHQRGKGTDSITVTETTPEEEQGGGEAAKNPTATTLTCQPGQVAVVATSLCTATVEDISDQAPAAPRGKVELGTNRVGEGAFADAGVCVLAETGPGVSACQLGYTPTASGAHLVSADYRGSDEHRISQDTDLINVTETTPDEEGGGGEAAKHPTETAVSCEPGEVEVGAPSICTALVTDLAATATAPAGTIEFATNRPGAFPVGASCELASAGADRATCEVPYIPSAVRGGSHKLTADYSADQTHRLSQGTFALTVKASPDGEAQVGTATSVACSPAKVVIANAADCSVIVTGVGGRAAPTGTVALASDGPGNLAASCDLAPAGPDSASCAFSYTPTDLGSKTHDLTAAYPGDGGHRASAGSFALEVRTAKEAAEEEENGDARRATATSVICRPSRAVLGRNASECTATVTDTADSGRTAPGGEVQLRSDGPGDFPGGATCALATAGPDSASCTVAYLPTERGSGSHALTAAYAGETAHKPSAGAFALAVRTIEEAEEEDREEEENGDVRNATATALVCQPSRAVLGDGGSLCTATVIDTGAANPSTPAGQVGFSSNGPGDFSAASCDLAPAGPDSASCAVPYTPTDLGSKTHSLAAAYAGEPAHRASAAAFGLAVRTAKEADEEDNPGQGPGGGVGESTTTVACQPAAILLGGDSVCTVAVKATGSAASGEVELESSLAGQFSGGNGCVLFDAGNGLASCQAVYTPDANTPGHHVIHARYVGDLAHKASSGETAIEVSAPTAGEHPSATALACAPSPVGAGAVSHCTVTVTDLAATPAAVSGPVVFATDAPGAFIPGGCALAPAGNGTASCAVDYRPSQATPAVHHLTAIYGGDVSHLPSRGAAQVAVTAPGQGAGAPPPGSVTPPPVTPPHTVIPDTRLLKKPKRKGAPTVAKFTFASDQPGSTFECRLDKKKFRPCRSPFKAKKLKKGQHVFRVRAVSAEGGSDPSPAVYHWKVGKAKKKHRR